MAEQLKGKFVITVDGDVKPLFATSEQWCEMSTMLKDGPVPVTTSECESDVFAILEVAKGYSGTGISGNADGVMMFFGGKEG